VFDVIAATSPTMAIKAADERGADCIVFDGAPHATASTLDVAQTASMSLIPTGLALDDLLPAVQLAQSMQAQGIDPQRIAFVLNHAGDSERETQEARDYLEAAGFYVVPGALRERTCYRLTLDQGRALTECQWAGAKDDAAQVMQAIINRLEALA
jgi:chromosome partitioning protein